MHLIPTFYRRFFYSTCKEYFGEHKSSRSKWRHRLNWIIFVVSCIVYSVYTYMMATDYRLELWRIEPIAYYLYQHKDQYDPFMVVMELLARAMIFYISLLLFRLPTNTKYWQWNYELTVGECDWYYQCVIKDERRMSRLYKKKELEVMDKFGKLKFWKTVIAKVVIQNWVKVEMFLHLDNLDKEKFFSKEYPMYPNLSNKIRARLIVILIAFDQFTCVYLLGFVVQCIAFGIVYVPVVCAPFPWYYWTTPLLTCIVFFDVASQIITTGHFYSIILFVNLYTTGKICKEMYSQLTQINQQFKRSRTLPIWYSRVLHRILLDHSRMCYSVIRNNRDYLENSAFVYILTNIPINIYFVSKATLFDIPTVERQICWLFIFIQFGAICQMIPVADQGRDIHAMARYIPALQEMLKTRQWLWFKLKYDDLFSRLTRGPKYTVCIGPLKEFTRFELFEVLLIYIGYLLMAFSQIIESRISNIE